MRAQVVARVVKRPATGHLVDGMLSDDNLACSHTCDHKRSLSHTVVYALGVC